MPTGIDRITHNRMAYMAHVNSYLMSTTGFQQHSDMTVLTKTLQQTIMRYRFTAVFSHCHLDTIMRMPADRFIDHATTGQHAIDHRLILAGDFMFLNLID